MRSIRPGACRCQRLFITLVLGVFLIKVAHTLMVFYIWENVVNAVGVTDLAIGELPGLRINVQDAGKKNLNETIPSIVHLIYKGRVVPEVFYRMVQKCRSINRNFRYVLWTDHDADRFVRDKYPELVPLYLGYNVISRTDFLRYAVLYHYGGYYMDMDMECLRPLDRLRLVGHHGGGGCSVDSERLEQAIALHGEEIAAPSAIACRPGHPFLRHVLHLLPLAAARIAALDMFRRNWLGRDTTFYATGPRFLTQAVQSYNRRLRQAASSSARLRSASVVVMPAWVFSPLLDADPSHFAIACGRGFRYIWWRIVGHANYEGCERLRRTGFVDVDVAERTRNSIAIHRYLHLGWTANKDVLRSRNLPEPLYAYNNITLIV